MKCSDRTRGGTGGQGKWIFLLIALAIMAGLSGCNSGGGGAGNKITLTLVSGSQQNATVGTAFSSLVAQLTKNGAPLSGVTVNFQAPTSGASGTFSNNMDTAPETTDSDGNATATFTANTIAGSYTVTAVVEGATQPVSFNLTNTAGAPAMLTASSGSGQGAIIGNTFNALVANVTDTYGNPVSNQQVTFTAPAAGAGAGGTFSNGSNTETDPTDANGNAKSTTFTANSTVGTYTVQATSGSLTAVNFNLTNLTTAGLAEGNYVFSLNGADASSYYSVAGVFTVSSSGAIVGGEEDFVDSAGFHGPVTITSGVVTLNATGDGNSEIALTTNDTHIGVNGVQTLDASMISGFKGLIIEYDSSATSSGRLDQQTSTSALCPTAPATACGYAFSFGGVYGASKSPVVVGGVATIDQANGVIDGTGSVTDINLDGTLSPSQSLTGTVSTPDSLGRVTFNMTAASTNVILEGYIVDSNHVRLVENNSDSLGGSTGGAAYGQTGTGAFSNSSIAGSNYVFSMSGHGPNGPLQVAGVLTFPSTGTSVTGTISYNDLTVHNAQGGTTVSGGTYSVDATGRVTLNGITDGTATYNLQMYLDGNGKGTIISMDATDEMRGQIYQQAATTLNASSLNGNYPIDLLAYSIGPPQERGDGVGAITASGGSNLSGFADENQTLIKAGTLAPDQTFSDTYANPTGTPSNGVVLVTGTGSGGALLTAYLIDTTQGVVIENDVNNGLLLGYFANQ